MIFACSTPKIGEMIQFGLPIFFQRGVEKPPAIVSGVRNSSNKITCGSMSSDESCGCLTCGVILLEAA